MTYRILTVLALASLLSATSALAQSRVTAVGVNGQPPSQTPPCAPAVKVSSQGQGSDPREVCVGMEFAQGTIIETPRGVTLVLKSVHAQNSVTMSPGTRSRLSDGPKGSSHTNFFGQMRFKLQEKLSFFNARDAQGNVVLSTGTTEFVTYVEGRTLRARHVEGVISVSKAVTVNVNQASDSQHGRRERTPQTRQIAYLTESSPDISHDLEEGEISFATLREAYDFFIAAYRQLEDQPPGIELADVASTLGQLLIEGGSAGDALPYLERALEINYARADGAPDLVLADDHSYLGWAYLEIGYSLLQADAATDAGTAIDEAIRQYDLSRQIRVALDPWDPLIADDLLNLSDVLHIRGAVEQSNAYSQAAAEFLTEIIQLDLTDLEIAWEADDDELADAIMFDVLDNLELLIEAYTNVGDTANAEYYRAQTDRLREAGGE